MKKTLEGNIALFISRTFSGLNMNALKYLIPLWMAPLTGMTIRLGFAALAFWTIDALVKKKNRAPVSSGDKLRLFLLGATGITLYMSCYLTGLKYTTPVASAIILALVPLWVFLINLSSRSERFTWLKGAGLAIGLGGALISLVSKEDSALALNPLLGNSLTLVSSIAYSFFLIISNRLLKRVSSLAMLKWTFFGATSSAILVNLFTGWDAPVLHLPFSWTPMLVLVFVLVFPTTISYLLIPIGLKTLNTTVVSMYGYLEIAIATVVGIAVGQDRFEWILLISIIMLCGGLLLVEKAEKT